ncbi:uroporphyrinogen-III C-methyltransferase [Halovivax cerinus]|uniref:uroporphyrinogen-III C-methyltransferase n=1 Tax=Halovivax cerinus TaxID=1487865 RepID=A0ABD5NUA7_9EURY|nr:uroporphyrinogen-III C-methyltransferase [Halovivax cerinus]
MSGAAGSVALVGAGPGDPDLLTVTARRRLDEADVILHDALVTDALLDTVPASADVVDVGKRAAGAGERATQDEINRLLVRLARRGRAVVRLKGGDPYVFGRGGEEAEFLAAAGVDVEVVPGVTSAVAAPAVAGIPVTHRDHASSLTVVTGHEDPTKAESALDWAALADTVAAGGTLVVLMGVGRLPEIVATLREHDLSADTPVAMVEKATWDDESTVTGTLSTIVARATDAGIEPPAVTVVGDVVAVRDRVIDRVRSARTVENARASTGVVLSDGGSR